MGRVQDRIAGALAAEVEGRTEWDEPPRLYFLYLEGGEPRLRDLEFPDEWWAADRPPVVLDAVSRCWGEYGDLLARAAPGSLHGAAFRSETWRVATSPPGSPGYAEAERLARAHRLREHPDKVEERTIWAVDRAGITYGAVLERGASQARGQVSYPGPGRKGITGTIPEALERIVAAVLGVTIG